MATYEQTRLNMIKQQIRTWEINNDALLEALYQLPRECFIPDAYHALAYADVEIALGHGRTMLTPMVLSKMIQALNLSKTDVVLEVGAGSGFGSALLGLLSKRVYALESHSKFSAAALTELKALQIHNVSFEMDELLKGLKNHAPYDAIMINGSLPGIPTVLARQLKVGGRMILISGQGTLMKALLVTRTSENDFAENPIFETVAPRLETVTEPNQFTF